MLSCFTGLEFFRQQALPVFLIPPEPAPVKRPAPDMLQEKDAQITNRSRISL